MEWGNLKNWLQGGTRAEELAATRAEWEETERLWRASPAARDGLVEIAMRMYRAVLAIADPPPSTIILHALAYATYDTLEAEDITAIEAEWPAIEADAAVAINFRQMLTRRRRWAVDFERLFLAVCRQLLTAYAALIEALPESCFAERQADDGAFEVPLLELIDDPVGVIEAFVFLPYGDDTLQLDLMRDCRAQIERNLVVASGFAPGADIREHQERVVPPRAHKASASSAALADLYLGGTPFRDVLDLPVPFRVSDEARFEHCHILGGTGHGKTQLLQRMIHADLLAAQQEARSVVVIDSQGDLINKLARLALFDPDAPESLADKLVLIDPADIEFPAALNLFDAHLDRLESYRPVDRERVLNGVVELYEAFFGDMLGAELTQKQGVIFRYLARLMVTIPGATIHTLMQLMDDGAAFRPQMSKLDGSARYFFETEFFHPSFAATKKQILRRLWGVLSTPAFERMFAQKANKLDLFAAMNEGKIILVSTAKDLLKEDGSALFGRFFIAMLKQAALERSVLPPAERTSTFVYVDEAQEYFDDSIETILNQARKYRVSLTMSHQALDQLTPRLRAALNSNTSLKCVGGVSAKDARAMADELRTSADFIESVRRRGDRTEFAVYLKQQTPRAIRLSVPLGFLERQPLMPEEALEALLTANRARYCGTLADVGGFAFKEPAEPPPARPAPHAAPVEPVTPPPQTPRPRPAAGPPRGPLGPREQGKGGSQHRYVQHLIKGLAEERGFRAVIEEAVPGGQVDVGLHKGELSIACEISVTSAATYEAQNLAKCLGAGFTRVFAVALTEKRLKAIEKEARERLSESDVQRIEFLTPEMLPAAFDAFALPPDETSTVRGYRVKVSRNSVSGEPGKDRRAEIARIIARSTR
jgi:hypothetical protein